MKEHQMSGRRSPYRLRFSITFLFSLTLGSAIFVCHFFVIRPELERRRLIDEIRSLGGKVDFEDGQSLSLFKSQKIASIKTRTI